MMVALPLAFNLTTPLEETAATLVLELLQVILSVELPGVNLPFTVKRYPLYAIMLFRFSRIRFAGISLTVTVQDAFFPLERVAVITAFPFLFAVTFPVLLTTATLVLELLHFGVSLALAGVVVAFRTAFFPSGDSVFFCSGEWFSLQQPACLLLLHSQIRTIRHH